jgi:DNA helicase-2/ATP-dependent DNA helicase PcrA
MDFDGSQRAVLALASGRHKLFAPPGSGKTELLAHRVRAAVERGLDPGRMACLTFTNRAARVMTERMPPACAAVFVGNFHAFGLRHLRREGLFPLGAAVLDEEDAHLFAVDAVERALGALSGKARDGLEGRWGGEALVGLAKGWFGVATRRRHRLSREAVEEAERLFGGAVDGSGGPGSKDPTLARFLGLADAEYQEQKRRSLALDFEDILSLTADSLGRWRRGGGGGRLAWVQVDEAQDLNAIQWSILDLLTDERSHVLILGDVQQSIFSFMGSSLTRLERETTGFTEHRLETSYRSPAYLLEFFGDYSRKVLRIPLDIAAADPDRKPGDAMRLYHFHSDTDERRAIARRIVPRLRECGSPGIAVLARTNAIAVGLSAELEDAGEEHFLVSHFDLFRTANAKDFLALLTVLRHPANRIAWMRLLRLFGATRTLGQARELVNELFEAAVDPADLLEGEGAAAGWRLESLADRVRGGRVVVFDVETTGLDLERSDIVQLAAVELRRGRPGRVLDLLLRTEQPLGETTGIHGLTAARLEREGLGREEALARFLEFAGDAPLAAHNLPFDGRMLDANLRRAGLPPHPGETGDLCTLRAARALYPGAPRHTLAALLAFLGLGGRNSHDARDDATAAALLLRRLARDAWRRRGAARRTLARHARALERFAGNLRPLMERIRGCQERPVGFEEVFELLVGRLARTAPSYRWEFEGGIRRKLLGHMRATCPPAPLAELLRRHLPRYLNSREPDLILEQDRLVVSTVHRAKGLEFDAVVVPHAVEGIYPSAWAIASGDPARIAEEARILYVAMTRARRRLVITTHECACETGRPRSCRPTRFLAGLDGHFCG